MNFVRLIAASVALFGLVMLGLPACATADPVAVGFGAGTLGGIVSVSKPVAPGTTVRLQYGNFGLDRKAGFDNVVIDVLTRLSLTEQFRLSNFGLFVDRRLGGRLHFTLGAIANQNRIYAVSVPADSSIVINNYVYSAAKAGQIFTSVKWMPYDPYVGFGFESASRRHHALSLVGEVGAFYEGHANVTFDSNGVIKQNQASFIRYYNTLERQLTQELSPVQVYPVLQFGVRLRM